MNNDHIINWSCAKGPIIPLMKNTIKNNILIDIPLHAVLSVMEIFVKKLNNICDGQNTSSENTRVNYIDNNV